MKYFLFLLILTCSSAGCAIAFHPSSPASLTYHYPVYERVVILKHRVQRVVYKKYRYKKTYRVYRTRHFRFRR